MRKALVFAALAATALAAPNALAQDTQTPTTGAGASGTVSTGVTTETTVTTPVAPKPAAPVVAAAPAAREGDDISDHEKVVGKFGIGYFGVSQLPLATGLNAAGNAASVGQGTLDTPVIGARYWMKERIGIDVGLGFGTTFGSTTASANNQDTTTSNPAALGIAVHGGVPLVLGHQKHYKFLVIPELNFGITRRTIETTNQPDVHLGGWRLDIGARAGAEIHFGFIGVPQLALQATVGLAFRHQAWSASRDAQNNTPEVSALTSQNGIGTTVQSDPWAIFTNNISAIYYFP